MADLRKSKRIALLRSSTASSSESSIDTEENGKIHQMLKIPDEIISTIALKMCKYNLTIAGNFLKSKQSANITLNDYFRGNVDLSPIIANPSLCNQSTFFMDCVYADNPLAIYLLGLEYVSVYGETEYGMSILESSSNERAIIFRALEETCMGNPTRRLDRLNNELKNWVTNSDIVHTKAQEIEHTILQFSHDRHNNFQESWDYPHPQCNSLHILWVCSQCFLFKHSNIVKGIC